MVTMSPQVQEPARQGLPRRLLGIRVECVPFSEATGTLVRYVRIAAPAAAGHRVQIYWVTEPVYQG
jgi:hypothetical protein